MWDWLPGGDPDKSKLELEMSEVDEDISVSPPFHLEFVDGWQETQAHIKISYTEQTSDHPHDSDGQYSDISPLGSIA